MQTGDFIEPSFGPAMEISSDVLEGWFGFSFGDSFRNRIRLGVLQASGDTDPFDDEEEAFFTLFGDVHQDGRLGLLDFYSPSNIQNINLAWTGTLADGRHAFGVAFHDFQLAENFFEDSTDDLGTEIDVTYDYVPNKVLAFQVGYGQLSGADALNNLESAPGLPRSLPRARSSWTPTRSRDSGPKFARAGKTIGTMTKPRNPAGPARGVVGLGAAPLGASIATPEACFSPPSRSGVAASSAAPAAAATSRLRARVSPSPSTGRSPR